MLDLAATPVPAISAQGARGGTDQSLLGCVGFYFDSRQAFGHVLLNRLRCSTDKFELQNYIGEGDSLQERIEYLRA